MNSGTEDPQVFLSASTLEESSETGSPPVSTIMSTTQASSSSTSSVSPTASITPESSHSGTTLALGISLAVVAAIVFGGLAFYFVRRHHKRKMAQNRVGDFSTHRRTYMVPVDPSHLAARVTPFGVGVNAPNVEVPKFGESLYSRNIEKESKS